MNVQEIRIRDPACCTADTGLHEVAQLMVENDCGCIPIVDSEDSKKPVGIITDRDVVTRVIAEGRNPLDLTAEDAMTNNVVTVTPQTSVEECCSLMEEHQLRRIAVVDQNGACCGIVAQADIAINTNERNTAEVVREVSKSAHGS